MKDEEFSEADPIESLEDRIALCHTVLIGILASRMQDLDNIKAVSMGAAGEYEFSQRLKPEIESFISDVRRLAGS